MFLQFGLRSSGSSAAAESAGGCLAEVVVEMAGLSSTFSIASSSSWLASLKHMQLAVFPEREPKSTRPLETQASNRHSVTSAMLFGQSKS